MADEKKPEVEGHKRRRFRHSEDTDVRDEPESTSDEREAELDEGPEVEGHGRKRKFR